MDDAREKSKACEEDVDQELKSAAIREENCHGREKKGGDERQQPTSVVSPAALAFTLSSTHLGSFLSFRRCAPEISEYLEVHLYVSD